MIPRAVVVVGAGRVGLSLARALSRLGEPVRLLGRVAHPAHLSPPPHATTLPHQGLPNDPDILRTATKHNAGNVGVYATVVETGTVEMVETAAFKQGAE